MYKESDEKFLEMIKNADKRKVRLSDLAHLRQTIGTLTIALMIFFTAVWLITKIEAIVYGLPMIVLSVILLYKYDNEIKLIKMFEELNKQA